jgi:hypothetical protein
MDHRRRAALVRMTFPGAAVLGAASFSACSATPTLRDNARQDRLPQNEARAVRLGTNGPWLQHEMAIARSGDVLIENELVRFYIKGSTQGDGYVPYPGWVVDAALAADGGPDYDGVDGFYPLVNLAPIAADDLLIENDGAGGERAVVVVSGPLIAVPHVLSVQGAQPRPFEANVHLEYSLGPHERALTLRTTVENASSETQEVDIGDVILFGDDEAEPFTVPGGFDRRSDLTQLDAIGSSHETRPVSYAVYASSPLVLLRGSSVRAQLGGDGSLVGYTVASTTLEPGASFDTERWLAVAPDVAGALEPRFRDLGMSTRRLAGYVGSAGARVGGARVSVFADAELQRWVTQTITDADGRFELALPEGEYHVLATGRTTGAWLHDPDAPRQLAEGYGPSGARAVHVSVEPLDPLELSLEPPARVQLSVRDPSGAPIAAKITFVAEDVRPELCAACGERALHDWFGARQVVWTADGTAELDVESGLYTVTASRGPNAEIDVRRGVSLPAGELTSLSLLIDERIHHPGYVAIDPHVHGVFSQHGEATRAARVVTALAEGLDVHVATDHDTIADYTPALSRLGIDQQLLSISGVEFETSNGDHCAWPLTTAPGEPFGGARRWWLDGRGIPETYRYYAERGAIVTHVAHGTSHFASAGYDIATGNVSDTSRFSFDFNAMEVHNGLREGGRTELVPIWMSLINFGHRVAPLAASDSHGRGIEVGVGRTYVRVGERPLTATTVAQETAALHTVASTGPFIELSTDTGSGPGDLLPLPAAGPVELAITVWAPSWMPIEQVQVWANGVVVERWDATTNPAVHLQAERAVWFEHRLPVHPDADEWYSIEATGGTDLAPVNPGSRPWALTGPLFIDADGDGRFAIRR